MLKVCLFLLGLIFFTVLATEVFSQSENTPLAIKRSPENYPANQKLNISPKQLLTLTRNNAAAYQEAQIARNNHSIGSTIGFIGGFFIGYPLGTVISGDKPNWAIAGVGGLLFVSSIPFHVGYSTHAAKAVKIYNEDIKPISQHKVDINLGIAANKLEIKVMF